MSVEPPDKSSVLLNEDGVRCFTWPTPTLSLAGRPTDTYTTNPPNVHNSKKTVLRPTDKHSPRLGRSPPNICYPSMRRRAICGVCHSAKKKLFIVCVRSTRCRLIIQSIVTLRRRRTSKIMLSTRKIRPRIRGCHTHTENT